MPNHPQIYQGKDNTTWMTKKHEISWHLLHEFFQCSRTPPKVWRFISGRTVGDFTKLLVRTFVHVSHWAAMGLLQGTRHCRCDSWAITTSLDTSATDTLVVGFNPIEKYSRQFGSSPQEGTKTKNNWNHHLVGFKRISKQHPLRLTQQSSYPICLKQLCWSQRLKNDQIEMHLSPSAWLKH